MTEFEKMRQGLPYSPDDEELSLFRMAARRLCIERNQLDPELHEKADIIHTKLFARKGNNVVIDSAFFCDYGMNLELGDNVFIGLRCTIKDSGHITIGNNVMIGNAVTISSVSQPLLPNERIAGESELSEPIIIGNHVRVGDGCLILSGVAIGEGAVILPGSVVSQDVEPFSMVSGNPATELRRLR
ncbi:sugar O-acetyltransferase [Vibrio sp. Of7-15]|uniref:sugar O-acetyltransferase n=1 Tax=Vibrio sp. Of7-15 TaxID=2724879 RepID=UPI001EF366C1|nr:sugar O-acetyltransferase [Vibrio sp. Of7-15]MCG7497008.1 sugar O-acetyltransferase [Vibrio sp. Of7-15]